MNLCGFVRLRTEQGIANCNMDIVFVQLVLAVYQFPKEFVNKTFY